MITVEPIEEWRERHTFDATEEECEECGGTGECPCCERECLECHGSGFREVNFSEREIRSRYFEEVMEAIKRLCAFSSRHDFLTEAGDFIKAHGRPDIAPWHRTTH